MIKLNIKAISPIVATSLLLIVTVLAVVGFQSWFMAYQSGVNAKVEQEGSMSSIVSLEGITGGMMYLKGAGKIQSVNIGGVDCDISGLTDTGVNSLPMGDCAKTGVNDVVIVTTKGVFSQKTILNNYVYKDECLTGFIRVPGNIDLGTKNFCVMKYEAKNVGGVAISQATNLPWVSITWQDAKIKCENLGSGYHLIKDEEWLTIARNVAGVNSNWVGGVLKRGNVGIVDGASYNGLDPEQSSDFAGNNLGLLNLSNGRGIWDFSGNVWEWTDKNISVSDRYHGGDQQWMGYISDDGTGKIASNVPSFMLPPNDWNADQGMGRYCDGSSLAGAYNNVNEAPDFCTGYCSSSAAFLRGGDWYGGAFAGAFALHLGNGPSFTDAGFGLRCSWSP